MVIVQVNFRRVPMPKAEWDTRYTDERAKKFHGVEGLQWKIWIDNTDERMAGGIYLFADHAAAEAYINGPIVAGLKANPELSDFDIRVFDVRDRMTAITHGPVPGLAPAAE